MTPQTERIVLAGVATEIEADLRAALAMLVSLIQGGADPREAVDEVMRSFRGEMAETMAGALSRLLAEAVGTGAVLEIRIGSVQLSQRLYAEAQAAGALVHGIVQRHVRGFQDARALARDLFEGYFFRPPGAEPLVLAPGNERLPRYLREALLPDSGVRDGLKVALARLQVDRLSSAALRAAYSEALDAISGVQEGPGRTLLEKRLRVVFFERMRFFAQRIAQTELHRAYAEREARLLLEDEDVEFVEIRRAPARARVPCICNLMVGRDLYGLGAGVYPKREAPLPPFHPFCRCVQTARLDLTGEAARPRDEGGDAYFLRRVGLSMAGQVMGSRAARDRVLSGQPAEVVANAGISPLYRIKRAGDVAPRVVVV